MGIFRQFPYSNFHEMNMDEIIKIMKTLQDEWEDTKSEWSDMQTFINNYFDNLDLDEETEKAIRKLIADGTLDQKINPLIISTTQNWLNNNITPTTPPVDKTLSISGAAADSAITGAAVDRLNHEYLPLTFINNEYVSRSDGTFIAEDGWSRTDYMPITGELIAYMPNGYNGYTAFYDENHNFIEPFYVNKTQFTSITIPENARYYAISNETAAITSLRIFSHARWEAEVLEHIKTGFFFHGTYSAQGELMPSTNTLITNIICEPVNTFVKIRRDSIINMYAVFYSYDGAYLNDKLINENGLIIPAGRPFRLFARMNDGTKCDYNQVNKFLVTNLSEYDTEAKLTFIGETPTSFPHSNATSFAAFNAIETSSNKIIINDSSHSSNNAFIQKYIFDEHHEHFDYFILSHWHSDHAGLLGEMIRWGCIDQNTVVFLPQDLQSNFLTVFPQETETWNLFNTFLPRLQNSGATLIYPTENKKYYIDDVVLEFWNTNHAKYYTLEATAQNYNDLSLCFYLTLGNTRVCYPGDLGTIGQEQCAASVKKCNILNAQHHGWDNGVNNLKTNYIDKISPEVVIADDGNIHDTIYQRDDAPMITWCETNSIPFYRCYSQADGRVELNITKNSWQIINPAQRFRRNSN